MGDLLQVANEVFIAPSDGDWFDFIPWTKNNVFHLPSATYEVIPDTVGQFTGLLDKNGKEIYEGDVVARECRYDGTRRLPSYSFLKFGKVSFQRCNCRFVMNFSDCELNLCNHYAADIEVAGNIYDNPELMK